MNKYLQVKKSSVVPVVFVIVAGAAYSSLSSAQVVTDGSFGAAVTLNGLDVEVVETLGTRAGNNLFHSFETFNIQEGGVVTFSGSAEINNVVSRVTGGEVSNINGELRSEVGSANFFFVNPAGVTFGAGGSVDVPASFHLSTAEELRFDDGSVLTTSSGATSVLSMATPEAFGFLGNGTGSINVDGEIFVGDFLDVDSQADITLSARNMTLGNNSLVQAPGAVRLAAIGDSAADFDLQSGAQNPLEGELEIGGAVGFFLFNVPDDVLVEAGTVQVSGGRLFSEGTMRVISNDLTVNDGGISSSGNIDVQTSNQLSVLNGGRIGSDELFVAGENVVVSAGQLLIDGQGSEDSTGIINDLSSGDIDVTVVESATIINGGRISSTDIGSDAGNISLSAGELLIDRQGSSELTGILSFNSGFGVTDSSGNIEVNIEDTATVQNGGRISTGAFNGDSAGNITLTAAQVTIDGQDSDAFTGVFSDTFADTTGDAGNVEVFITEITTVQNGGQIGSTVRGEGSAGNLQITTGQLVIDDQGSDAFTGIFSDTAGAATGNAGSVEVSVAELATILDGGAISSETFSEGNAGNVVVSAGQLLIDRQASDAFTGILSITESAGNGGDVAVTVVEQATIINGGEVSTGATDEGSAGNVVVAVEQLDIDGNFSGIFSNELGGTGRGGDVEVTITEIATIQDGGQISTASFGQGGAGDVDVVVGQLLIDGQEGEGNFTGIFSNAGLAATGSTGNVDVTVRETATIQDRGIISTATFSGATAGSIEVSVAETITLQSGGMLTSDSFDQGNGGTINLVAGQLIIDGQSGEARTGISSFTHNDIGNAGSVEVSVTDLVSLRNGGVITSGSTSAGNAGSVVMSSGQLEIEGNNTFPAITGIDSSVLVGSTGNAGSVEVSVAETASIQNGGQITSDTFGVGDAGNVVISAGELIIDSQDNAIAFTGVSSEALSGTSGNAGNVEVTVTGLITVRNSGQINSNSRGEGDAGSVLVSSRELLVDGRSTIEPSTGILSFASGPGNAGTVEVNIEELATVRDRGLVSTSAFGGGDAGNLTISSTSGSIVLLRGAQILSDAQGSNNNSGSVSIDVGGRVVVERAEISTESEDGEAGSITIAAGALSTNDVIIATTTESLTADGGDINLNSEVFALQDTVIQANATSGTGGEITIDSSVIPFANQFNTQLDAPLNLSDPDLVSFGNVAQAVAPTGLSVPPEINSPEVDISGALSELDSDLLQAPKIGADPCSVVQSGAPSTLIESGRGGLPNNDLQRSISFQQILNKPESKDSTVYFIEQKPADIARLADSSASGIGGCRNTY